MHKATSPKIKCKYNEVVFPSLLDSGAEINVLDQDFVNKVGICVSNTSEKAHAANKLPLEITGQTMEPVTIQCWTSKGYRDISLGIMLVVANLGVPCLIGEPGKDFNTLSVFLSRKW